MGVYEVTAYISGGNNYLNDTLYAQLEITPVTITFSLKDQNTHPTTCTGAQGNIAFSSNLPAGTYLLGYTLNGNPEQKEVEVLTGGEFTLTGLAAGVYSGFSINMSTVGTGSATGSVTLINPETASLAVASFDHPTASSTNSGKITFTTTLADDDYTLNYSRASVLQTPRSVTVTSGEFTVTGLNASTYSGVTYSGFSITDPVSECEAIAPESVTLGNKPTLTGVGTYEAAGFPRTATSAYVRATLNTGSSTASGRLIYGTDPTLTSGTTTRILGEGVSAGVGAGYRPPITGLTQNTTYYFKFTGQNAYGTVQSSIYSFRTRSTNANLTALVPGKGSLSPSFKSSTTNYTVTLANSETGITFTPTAAAYATIRINGTAISSGTESAEIPLNPGNNTVTFRVDAEAGNTNTYTVNVIRKQTQTITFPSVGDLTYGDPNPLLNATASSTLDVTYSTSDNSIANAYSDGGSTRRLNIKKAGTLTITASQTGNGTYEAAPDVQQTISIAELDIIFAVSGQTHPEMCSGAEGSITFSGNLPNNAVTVLNYKHNGEAQQKTVSVFRGEFKIENLTAGVYSDFSIDDPDKGAGTLSETVTLSEPVHSFVLETLINPATCGGTDGSIAFTSTGLTDGTYVLHYSDGVSSLNTNIKVTAGKFALIELPAGTYTGFSITTRGCTGSVSGPVTLSDPTAPTLTLETTVNPTTCSGTDGSIAFTSTGLTDGNYTMNYSANGSTTSKPVSVADNKFTLTELPAGAYSGFAITTIGCTATASGNVTLADPVTPTLTLGTTVNPTTCSGTDGSIAFTSTGLTDGNYTMNYSANGSTTSKPVSVADNKFTLTELPAGAYSGFAITTIGCTATASGNVT
ncbi:MAG: cadherin-like beta sandwich domain-containing protein, partial [Leadbetterella sp.]|nr:cadherin-like beta sandwich domain-containing protein [Leadbetterella sp.]